jgi:hypothetical protein
MEHLTKLNCVLFIGELEITGDKDDRMQSIDTIKGTRVEKESKKIRKGNFLFF